ncbi:MAG: TPD domain-containing protein [Archaeoglobaceae archaeon]|nr:C15orf41 family protein [Archaeoglobaceae archaeon]MDW7990154.1 TPD domain-containing protein [Archaeoglobaceae archaeon]
MKVRLLLKAMDFSTKEINKALINPDILDSKLSDLVYRAVTMDFVYSPIATKIQCVFGQIGERIVEEELKNLKIKFKREKELKTQKTPDFLFEEPLEIFERKIRWIESKSLFADHRVYEIYSKKQFLKYREIFGEGLVIFWLGCLEGIEVSDGSEFGADLKNKLLEMKIKVIVDEEIDGNPLKITEDFIMRYADCHRFPYNSEVIRILKNMGFVVEKED